MFIDEVVIEREYQNHIIEAINSKTMQTILSITLISSMKINDILLT